MPLTLIPCDCGTMLIAFAGGGADEEDIARDLAERGESLQFADAEHTDDIVCPTCGKEHNVYDGEFVTIRAG